MGCGSSIPAPPPEERSDVSLSIDEMREMSEAEKEKEKRREQDREQDRAAANAQLDKPAAAAHNQDSSSDKTKKTNGRVEEEKKLEGRGEEADVLDEGMGTADAIIAEKELEEKLKQASNSHARKHGNDYTRQRQFSDGSMESETRLSEKYGSSGNDSRTREKNEALRKAILDDTNNVDHDFVSLESKLKQNAVITQTESFDPDKFKRANTKLQHSHGAPTLSSSNEQDKIGEEDKIGDWSPAQKAIATSSSVFHIPEIEDDLGEEETSRRRNANRRPQVIQEETTSNQNFEFGQDGDEDPLLDSQDEAMMDAILEEHGW
mmetsp:Transcript_32084/g.56318  ORF Transcript_32084/g.56318 Transcript_32084/m.56318 type:complete len:320 (-) Transcript_32084:160-1119(-)